MDDFDPKKITVTINGLTVDGLEDMDPQLSADIAELIELTKDLEPMSAEDLAHIMEVIQADPKDSPAISKEKMYKVLAKYEKEIV